ncbi:MAG: aldo/keto reductase [Bacteroidales bacterium]|nr:aldo/keto reductase [Bacteroidales bacterium]
MEDNKKNISRRDFMKVAGAGALAVGAAACAPKSKGPAITASAHQTGDGEMEYRINPKNGDRISLLGYGCMRWQMKRDESTGRQVIDQDSVNALVARAMEGGVNYYDTSPAYLQGQSEKAAGIALSRYPRNSYYIATKLSNFNNATPQASQQMYRDSFDQLQTDYFDYYLMHAIGSGGYAAFSQRYVDNGMMEFLMKEREAGRIRNMGFSFHGTQAEFDELIKTNDQYHWDFIQIEMNYIDWRHANASNTNAEYLYEQLDKLEIPITVMEPLLGGRLSTVPENVARRFKERDPDASIPSWAFRFVGSHPRVITTLSGMVYMEHLEDNLKTFRGFHPMTDEELEFMNDQATLYSEFPMINCTGCKYCMPCPYGINIPEIFAYYNKCVTEEKYPQSQEQEGYKKLRREYLRNYDKAIPTVRQADHCIACRQCMEHCPQSIQIPNELQRIDHYIESLKQNTL